MVDHVHVLIALPPKYAVSQVIGLIKGKSAIHLARVCGERKRNSSAGHTGQPTSGSTPVVGRDGVRATFITHDTIAK